MLGVIDKLSGQDNSMEEIDKIPSTEDDSASDSKNGEWAPGNNLGNMIDDARRKDPGECLSDEGKEYVSHIIERNIENETEKNLQIKSP